jgi:hypothetical protein
VLLSFFLSPALSAETWIVAKDGSGDFMTIQAAVDAATDGDVILIRAGTYVEDVIVLGKGVALVGSGPDVVVSGDLRAISITDVPQGSTAIVAHLTLIGFYGVDCALRTEGDALLSNVHIIRTNYDGVVGGPIGIGSTARRVGRAKA